MSIKIFVFTTSLNKIAILRVAVMVTVTSPLPFLSKLQLPFTVAVTGSVKSGSDDISGNGKRIESYGHGTGNVTYVDVTL